MGFMELRNIAFRYAEEEPCVFEDFSMSVDEGTFLLVEGDNGSGKTTLFRILNGLSFPERGSYLFDGIEVTQKYLKNNTDAKRFHKRIGYLFQNPDIMLFNARVYDEIAFGPRQMGLTDAEVDARVKDCLELFDLAKLSDKAPYHLSGGQKRKTAMAAVMALNPEVVILDEPYAGLDRKSQDTLTQFLGELKNAGKTLIVATHNADLPAGLADERLIL